MFKRALVAFAELNLWLVAISILLSGFSHPANAKERPPAAGKRATSERPTSKARIESVSALRAAMSASDGDRLRMGLMEKYWKMIPRSQARKRSAANEA